MWAKQKALSNGIRSIRHHDELAIRKLPTTESQIATGGDLNFSSCVAYRVKFILNESWDVEVYCGKGKRLRGQVWPLNR